MLQAIVYTSNSGYTKEYAKLLSEELGIPAYSMKKAPRSLKGASVFYMGWVMAGGVKGFEKAQEKYEVKGLAQVGMAPASEALSRKTQDKYNIADMKVFTLRGGFDIDRLHGMNKTIMQLKGAQIKASLKKGYKNGTLNEEQLISWKMVTEGYSCVSGENLAEIVAWAKAQ